MMRNCLYCALFAAERVDEAQTIEVMQDFGRRHAMQIDPHSAVGLSAARRAILPDGVPMVTLATAHPAKFPPLLRKPMTARPTPGAGS